MGSFTHAGWTPPRAAAVAVEDTRATRKGVNVRMMEVRSEQNQEVNAEQPEKMEA
jgi:hypothetical protein